MPHRSVLRVDRHKCPVCKHTCAPARPVSTGRLPRGRPPTEIVRFGNWLAQHSSQENPLTAQQIADQYGLSPYSVHTYILRARAKGFPILHVYERGYWMPRETTLQS